MNNRWFNDEHYKAQLMTRVGTGSWYVVADNLPGLVVNVVYSGYKIQLPDGSTTIVNPDKLGEKLRDVTPEEYPQHVAAWNEVVAAREREAEAARQAIAALAAKQAACLHPETVSYYSCRAAGCDIEDTYCKVCDKVLRRSWSTASDRDPDDHVSDWAWWVRKHERLYQQTPTRANYVIVESIDDNLPAHHCLPRPN
jgi:hypothetical protein